MSSLHLWMAILGMTGVTFALRASFLLLPPHVDLPPLLKRALRYVPVAVMTALWAPELVLQEGVVSLSPGNERLLGGVLAVAVAWRYRMTFATILAGLLGLHLFDWML